MARKRLIRRAISAVATLAIAAGVLVAATLPAEAYATNGCTWSSATLNVRNQMPSGTYSTVAVDSISAWSTSTDVNLSPTTSTSAAWSIKTYDQGANGYSGYSYWTCLLGHFTNAQATLNPYYTDGYSTSKKRAVAVHELGHTLGLAHASGAVIMNSCPGCMWDSYAFWTPRTDDRNGINALY